ncbi:MAG TPA: hypothetical protein PKG80_08620, partial [Acidobacteriota bacterium]|nr:hypothetical protein [Acidobacteriota bacterium]
LLHGADFETALAVVETFTKSDLSGVSPVMQRSFRIDDAEVTYAYTDEHGDVLYKIARFVPKTFRPFVPSPDRKWWVMGLPKKTRRVLYQLPEVLRVREAGGTIYLVEGKKDADNEDDRDEKAA